MKDSIKYLIGILLLGLILLPSSGYAQRYRKKLRRDIQKDENGAVIARFMVNKRGYRIGKQQTFYPNGSLKSVFILDEVSVLTDTFKRWYDNGQQHIIFVYKKGRRVGRQQMWDHEGNILEDIVMKEGDWKIEDRVQLDKKESDTVTDSIWAQEPKPLNMGKVVRLIAYPRMAIESGIQGQEVFRILVGEDGKVKKAKYLRYVHPILTSGVESMIYDLEFTPAISQGKAIRFWVNIPFNFALTD